MLSSFVLSLLVSSPQLSFQLQLLLAGSANTQVLTAEGFYLHKDNCLWIRALRVKSSGFKMKGPDLECWQFIVFKERGWYFWGHLGVLKSDLSCGHIFYLDHSCPICAVISLFSLPLACPKHCQDYRGWMCRVSTSTGRKVPFFSGRALRVA